MCILWKGNDRENVADIANGESGGRQVRSFVPFLQFFVRITQFQIDLFKLTFRNDRIAHVVLPEDPLVPSTSVRQFTTTFNSSSQGFDTLCWPLRVPAHMWHSHIETCTQAYKNIFKNDF